MGRDGGGILGAILRRIKYRSRLGNPTASLTQLGNRSDISRHSYDNLGTAAATASTATGNLTRHAASHDEHPGVTPLGNAAVTAATGLTSVAAPLGTTATALTSLASSASTLGTGVNATVQGIQKFLTSLIGHRTTAHGVRVHRKHDDWKPGIVGACDGRL